MHLSTFKSLLEIRHTTFLLYSMRIMKFWNLLKFSDERVWYLDELVWHLEHDFPIQEILTVIEYNSYLQENGFVSM